MWVVPKDHDIGSGGDSRFTNGEQNMQQNPAQAYDRGTTIFSPDGRLFQVEYAREAVKRGTTAVGIRGENCVVLLVDKRVGSRLALPQSIEKIFVLDEHVGCASSGLVADARALVDRARMDAQMNRVTYDESIPVETLVKKICDFKQSHTQFGGARPFGTALLVAGIDDHGPHLFETDPSGALIEYKAAAVGSGRNAAMDVFEKSHADGLDMDGAIELGLKALHAATDGKLNGDALEIAFVNGEESFQKLPVDEVRARVDAFEGK